MSVPCHIQSPGWKGSTAVPPRTVKELAALARARPGELTKGVSRIIGGGRIAGEMFKDVAKTDMINRRR